jgi:hypothetical protein
MVDAMLSGGNSYLNGLSQSMMNATLDYIDNNPSALASDALYQQLSAVVGTSITATQWASILKVTGYGAAAAFAIAKVVEAPSEDRGEEIFKQATLYGAGLVASEAVADGVLLALGLTAATASAPVLAMVAVAGAIGAGVMMKGFDAEWDNIITFVGSEESSFLDAATIQNDTVTSFATSAITGWADVVGVLAMNAFQDSEVGKNINNIFNMFKSSVPGGAFPDGDSTSLPSWTSFVASEFAASMTPLPVRTDPIVLDLSSGGTGVELTSIDDSDAYFDLHDTGTPVHTGWVGPTTGILVNPNLDGSVTSIENLFGNSSTNGFTALQAA